MRDTCTEISLSSGIKFNSEICPGEIDDCYVAPTPPPLFTEEYYWRKSLIGQKFTLPSLDSLKQGWGGATHKKDRKFWIAYYAMWIRFWENPA